MEVLFGSPGQLGVLIVQGPAYQFLAHRSIVSGLVAREVGQQAQQIVEDPSARRVRRPGELGAVAVQPLSESLQTTWFDGRLGDGGNTLLVEESTVRFDKGRQESMVVGDRFVEHQDPVGAATHVGFGMIGECLETAPDQVARAVTGLP